MSLLTSFISAASLKASSVIGAESITIGGGTAVNAVLSEVVSGSEYQDAGFDPSSTLDAVIRRADWIVAYALDGRTYRKKACVARGQSFRIDSVEIGQAFVKLRLTAIEKS